MGAYRDADYGCAANGDDHVSELVVRKATGILTEEATDPHNPAPEAVAVPSAQPITGKRFDGGRCAYLLPLLYSPTALAACSRNRGSCSTKSSCASTWT